MTHDPGRAFPSIRLLFIGLGAAAALALFSGHADSQKKEAPPSPKDGTKVEWEGWSFNWALRRTEGLVLTDVHFRGRKVLKYAGIAELFTVYDRGSPRPIDMSQNGLGEPRAPIVPGLDCSSGEWCKVFDAQGKEWVKGASAMVMMHEEKTGPNYLGQFGRARQDAGALVGRPFFRTAGRLHLHRSLEIQGRRHAHPGGRRHRRSPAHGHRRQLAHRGFHRPA